MVVKIPKKKFRKLKQLSASQRDMALGLEVAQEAAGRATRTLWENARAILGVGKEDHIKINWNTGTYEMYKEGE